MCPLFKEVFTDQRKKITQTSFWTLITSKAYSRAVIFPPLLTRPSYQGYICTFSLFLPTGRPVCSSWSPLTWGGCGVSVKRCICPCRQGLGLESYFNSDLFFCSMVEPPASYQCSGNSNSRMRQNWGGSALTCVAAYSGKVAAGQRRCDSWVRTGLSGGYEEAQVRCIHCCWQSL